MTYREACACLARAEIENGDWDAACLISHFCDTDLGSIPSEPDRDYPSPALASALRRRASHEPLQYILGTWDFYRQTYFVSPDCLIPRSDTEILVEEAIRRLPHGAHFADLCTGSGCIAISTLAERPDTTAMALEKYPQTLALAQKNAAHNRVLDRLELCLADVLEPPPFPAACFDAILSNPPYIASREIEGLSPEVKCEPHTALDGGEDGLLFYRAMLTNWAKALKTDGFFLFEIGYDQAAAVTALAHAAGFPHVTLLRDLGGRDRVLRISRAPLSSPTKGSAAF